MQPHATPSLAALTRGGGVGSVEMAVGAVHPPACDVLVCITPWPPAAPLPADRPVKLRVRARDERGRFRRGGGDAFVCVVVDRDWQQARVTDEMVARTEEVMGAPACVRWCGACAR